MTSATEELRRLLDERGVKWWEGWDKDLTCYDGANGVRYLADAMLGEMFFRSVLPVTPAQAVEATLGKGTCHIEEQGCEWRCTGCGEVVGSSDPSSELHVSGNFVELWDHCPMCGRRVAE